jgi:hypothetical protein
MNYKSVFAIAAFQLVSASFVEASCYRSSIVSPTPFMGNNGEVFRLDDGSLWEIKYEYEYLYEYTPDVVICPDRGTLLIKGKSLDVAAITKAGPAASSGVIESQIDGTFDGWSGETIFKLTNGQIWQQSSYAYTYSYKYRPDVLIYPVAGGYELQVEGVDGRIRVTRLR